MHELSLCGSIADIAIGHANGRPVENIRLRIGHLRQVVPETLRFCWDMHSRGTLLEGCELVVDHVPVVIECMPCGATTRLDHPVLRCGSCDSTDVVMISGDEFIIESIDVVAEDTIKETG